MQINKLITILVLLLLIPTALAIKPSEKQSIIELLDQSVNDKNLFEVFLAFADDMKYNFKDEPDIQAKIETNAKKHIILLMPYQDMHGLNKPRIDTEILEILDQQQKQAALKLAEEKLKTSKIESFWPVVIILVAFIIVFSVLELYRREKIGSIRKEKTKAKIRKSKRR